MRGKAKSFIARHMGRLICLLCTLGVIAATVFVYVSYLDDRIYEEGANAVQLTYRQTAKTFALFAQRNWNYLSDVDNYIAHIDASHQAEDLFTQYASRANNWEYSDVYLFNQTQDYRTIAKRSGRAESIAGVFDQLFEGGEPCLTSYIASDGERKVVFARLLTSPMVIDGTTYTALAVSYENATLQDFLSANAFGGNSDCYVVDEKGDVVFSLEEKSVVTDFVSNFTDFFLTSVDFARGDAASFAPGTGVTDGKPCAALVTYNGEQLYAVWVPTDLEGMSLVALVDSGQVDRTSNDVRNASICAFAVILITVCGTSLGVFYYKYRCEMAQKAREREALERKNKMTTQLFEAMAQSYDRYAMGDLVRDTYEYKEFALDAPLYPEAGTYRDLIGFMNRRYTLHKPQDGETIESLLSPGRLQRVLGHETGYVTFEYETREPERGEQRVEHLRMNVVPVGWLEDGSVSRVLLFAQNISTTIELETQAMTDELTGLNNKRCFAELTSKMRQQGQAFTLYYLDLDRFKQVNDTFGHETGDKLLQEVSRRMRTCVRASDYAFRLGGDEFALVTCGSFDAGFARLLSSRLQKAIEAPFVIGSNTMYVGASCGFAGWPDEGETLEQIQALADGRMYREKKAHHEVR